MIKDEPTEVVLHASAPLEERLTALDQILDAMPEPSVLLLDSDEGTHLSVHHLGTKQNRLVPLVMVAVLFLIDKWKESVGAAGAERLFAMLVSEISQRAFPERPRRRERGN